MTNHAEPPTSADVRIAELTRELELLRRIFHVVPVMLYQWVLNAAGEARFTHVSEGCKAIYGLTPAQLLADIRYSLEVVHPEDMPGFLQAVTDSSTMLTPFHWVGRLVMPSEPEPQTKWVRATSFPTRMADGGTRWEGVIIDITEQCHAEEARRVVEVERERLVARLLEQNETLLRQASIPVIPLARGVIALPLIGDVDPARAEQIMQVLLAGVSEHRARVVIIDITGVRSLDVQGAGALIRAAQGIRLLGAEAVVTGLNPTIAVTLAGLDVELRGLRTLSTFEDGLVFALGAGSSSMRPR